MLYTFGDMELPDKQEQSIEDQKNTIGAYVAENGLHFLRFYVDDAIGGISTLGRHTFLQMIVDPREPGVISTKSLYMTSRDSDVWTTMKLWTPKYVNSTTCS